ncbi:MAG: Fe-S cluster assembly protein SufD [Bacteroidetes bacterium]|nr:Fe-S cluster assembly protein SufD [Bacteroidota bacterium]
MKTETTLTGITLKEKLIRAFEEEFLPGLADEKPFMKEIRQQSIETFQSLGFPHQKMEDWRSTSLQKTLSRQYIQEFTSPSPKEDVSKIFKCDIHHLDTHLLTLLNGWHVDTGIELTVLPDGMIFGSFNAARKQYPELFEKYYAKQAPYLSNGLIALNTAFAHDGIFIYVPDGVVATRTIQIVNIINQAENLFIQPRNLVILGKNASLQLVHCDHSVQHKASFVNSVTEIFLGENSFVDHYKLQNKDNDATVITNSFFHQSANSRLISNVITFNGGLIRNNLSTTLAGQGADAQLFGLYLADKDQHVDNNIMVDHQSADCTSNQLYKGILDDQAMAVFNGHIKVRRDSQRTVASQNNKNILLSDKATIHTQPHLEIFADDVKCSHGATVGQLDPEAMFYMRSRGIREDTSRMLMMYAFAADVINHIQIPPVRHQIDEMVYRRLKGELSNCDQCIIDCNATRPQIFEIDMSKI